MASPPRALSPQTPLPLDASKTSPIHNPQVVNPMLSRYGEEDDPDGTKPVFIYGGPFIKLVKPSMFLDTATPVNLPLQGTFRRSYAYYSLKERLPVILTKIIDYVSREAAKIKASEGASDQDLQSFIAYISKLKNELVTNKKYSEFTAPNPELKKWNEWMQSCDAQNYFGNTWLWTECYVYRRLKEGCELTNTLQNFDYFQEAKQGGFYGNLEPMCVVAERMMDMIVKSERPKRKEDFITLLKVCMWSNRCDMSLSVGEQMPFSSAPPPPPPNAPPPAPPKGKKKGPPPGPPPDPGYVDPFTMITNNKEYLLIDDSGKAFEQLTKKSEALANKIANNTTFKAKCSCHRLATLAGIPKKEAPTEAMPPPAVEGEEPSKIPCPAKMVLPQAVIFDIICDNAGYELFTDLCFAHFLIAQEMVQKIRFHVKKYPWFVSDVTLKDFRYVIEQCRSASFSKQVQPPGQTPPLEGETPPPPRIISSEALNKLGAQWAEYLDSGIFQVMAEDFWTYPHGFKDMKRVDPNMYRKMQFAVMALYKGDLNYRKLLCDRNVVSIQGIEPSLQGYMPAPMIAARTVKSDVICGLPKVKPKKGVIQPSKAEQLSALDDKWMQRGYLAVIQMCPKVEPFKPAATPCVDYGTTCFSATCPLHTDI